jgi:hypothetical protein
VSFNTKQVTVGTVAVQVLAPMTNPTKVLLHNAEKSSNEFIWFGGSADVTTSTGAHLDNSDTYQFELSTGNQIWAITNSGTKSLHVIWQVV